MESDLFTRTGRFEGILFQEEVTALNSHSPEAKMFFLSYNTFWLCSLLFFTHSKKDAATSHHEPYTFHEWTSSLFFFSPYFLYQVLPPSFLILSSASSPSHHTAVGCSGGMLLPSQKIPFICQIKIKVVFDKSVQRNCPFLHHIIPYSILEKLVFILITESNIPWAFISYCCIIKFK